MVQQRKIFDGSNDDIAFRRNAARHLDAMLALCESVTCRRGQLLEYFGQTPAAPACGNCDTCLTPPESWDGTVAAQKLLSTVFRLQKERNQKFGAGQSIDILLGKRTEKVVQFRHDELSVFGIGSDLRETEWRGVVRQLLAGGYLAVQGEYGTLALTERSAEVLRGERTLLMRRETAVARTSRSSGGRSSSGRSAPAAAPADFPESATPLFERLRAWRGATAKEQGVPAYVIFHDATLRAIAALAPASMDQLGTVNGVGQSKLTKFGDQVLAVVRGEEPTATADPGAEPAAARAPRPSSPGQTALAQTTSGPAAGRPAAGRPVAGPPLFDDDEVPLPDEPPMDEDY